MSYCCIVCCCVLLLCCCVLLHGVVCCMVLSVLFVVVHCCCPFLSVVGCPLLSVVCCCLLPCHCLSSSAIASMHHHWSLCPDKVIHNSDAVGRSISSIIEQLSNTSIMPLYSSIWSLSGNPPEAGMGGVHPVGHPDESVAQGWLGKGNREDESAGG